VKVAHVLVEGRKTGFCIKFIGSQLVGHKCYIFM